MELKEATKQSKKFIKAFKKDDTKSVIGFDVQAIEAVLQALEKLQKHCKEMIKEKQELTSALLDSIPKKKIEDELEITVEKYNKAIAKFDFKECQNLSSLLYESIKLEVKKQILKELLEDKQICK